jgi:hypothetical protein
MPGRNSPHENACRSRFNAVIDTDEALCSSCVILTMRYGHQTSCSPRVMLTMRYAHHPFTSFLFMSEAGGFADECLSNLQVRDGPSGVAYLKALALQNGFRLSARDSDKGDRIRLYCHRASRGEGHRRTTKTACPLCSCPHAIEECRMYKAFLVEKTRYVGVTRGKIHCKLCA